MIGGSSSMPQFHHARITARNVSPLNRSDVRFKRQGRIFPTAVCPGSGAGTMKSCKAGGGPLDVG
jgi:hypothetical protein